MSRRRGALTKGEQMARVRSKDTGPEIDVRRFLFYEGVRYRLHRRDLPGRPDIYIPRLRVAIFVNGCFWHGHNCRRAGFPKTNADFWRDKIARNVARDKVAIDNLRAMGVEVVTLWTCQVSSFHKTCLSIARRYRNETRSRLP